MAKDIRISSPLNGKLVPLNSINDPVFASGAMGRGVAVQNPKGQVFSPFDGEITVFFPTGHAIGLKSNDGIELLIHVGMDTVKMNGEGFTPKAEAGDKIKRGQLLLEFSPEAKKRATKPRRPLSSPTTRITATSPLSLTDSRSRRKRRLMKAAAVPLLLKKTRTIRNMTVCRTKSALRNSS